MTDQQHTIEDLLARLERERLAADRLYNAALTAVDHALQAPPVLPDAPRPYDPSRPVGQQAVVNAPVVAGDSLVQLTGYGPSQSNYTLFDIEYDLQGTTPPPEVDYPEVAIVWNDTPAYTKWQIAFIV